MSDCGGESEIGRAKVMSPFRNAMTFVDSDEIDFAALQAFEELWTGESHGRC